MNDLAQQPLKLHGDKLAPSSIPPVVKEVVEDPYAELKTAHAAGKRIRVKGFISWSRGNHWNWDNPPDQYEIHPDDLTLPPFDLDAHCKASGFVLAPGQEWHRKDWTAEMLPPGTRPLLKYTTKDAGDYEGSLDGKSWNEFTDGTALTKATENPWAWWRTTRPLPSPTSPVEGKSLKNIVQGIVSERMRFTLDAPTLEAVIATVSTVVREDYRMTCHPEMFQELKSAQRELFQAKANAQAVVAEKYKEIERLRSEDESKKSTQLMLYGQLQAARERAESAEARVKELEHTLDTFKMLLEEWKSKSEWVQVENIGLAGQHRMDVATAEVRSLRQQLATARADERRECVERVKSSVRIVDLLAMSTVEAQNHICKIILSPEEPQPQEPLKTDEQLDQENVEQALQEPAIKDSLTAEPEWIEHDGGECPLKDEEVKEWEFKDESGRAVVMTLNPQGAFWKASNSCITYYRVTKYKPGFGPSADTPTCSRASLGGGCVARVF